VIEMSEEKTLLEQVQEKEIALADEYACACADADARKEAAVRDGLRTIEQADAEERAGASARYEAAMAALEQEIEEARRTATERERALSSAMERRVPEVAAELVAYVVRVS
jgi:phytoene dehydrogenase-like protein